MRHVGRGSFVAERETFRSPIDSRHCLSFEEQAALAGKAISFATWEEKFHRHRDTLVVLQLSEATLIQGGLARALQNGQETGEQEQRDQHRDGQLDEAVAALSGAPERGRTVVSVSHGST